MIRLIVGLGNPGRDYVDTRHNAGFWFIDKFASQHKVGLSLDKKYFGFIGKFKYDDHDVWLLKPETFMNLSGKAVAALANFYKIQPSEILVAHDELDFNPGIVKLKLGGGAGGHNGLKDINRVIGNDYWRLRLGIGHPGDKNEVVSFVLKKPPLAELSLIEDEISQSLTIMDLVLSDKLNDAMKKLHTSLTKPV